MNFSVEIFLFPCIVSLKGYNIHNRRHKKMQSKNMQQELQDKINSLFPIAKGSLRKVKKSCSRPGCKLCSSGEKHSAWLFTYYLDGKQYSKHVPKNKVEMLQQALINGRKLEQLMIEAGLELLNKEKKDS